MDGHTARRRDGRLEDGSSAPTIDFVTAVTKILLMTEELADCFSPEERRRGEQLLDGVLLSSSSDTDVRAIVKNCRVNLAAESIESHAFASSCTCPAAGKGNLCKHIWAVLLKLDGKDADFLHGKTTTDTGAAAADPKKLEMKERQATFRKASYEKQKTRAKEIKAAKSAKPALSKTAFAYPADVEEARAYFARNGFELPHPLEMDDAINARKVLARVFHPDKGGSHDEALELNENFAVIRDYLES